MKLCDCFCYVGGLNDGEYLFKNKLFPHFKVSFQKKNYEVIESSLLLYQIESNPLPKQIRSKTTPHKRLTPGRQGPGVRV